jgi:hypothetical protein
MRIVVASTFAPLVPQRADRLADRLAGALTGASHEVERVRIPFADRHPDLLGQLLALRLTDVAEDGDLMIALGSPAHLLRHRRKVVWLVESEESDDWGARLELVSDDQQEVLLRDAVISSDALGLGEAQRVFVSSSSLGARLLRLHRLGTERLKPPSEDSADVSWNAIVATLTG